MKPWCFINDICLVKFVIFERSTQWPETKQSLVRSATSGKFQKSFFPSKLLPRIHFPPTHINPRGTLGCKMPKIPAAAATPEALCSLGRGLYLQCREQRADRTQKASGDASKDPHRMLQARETSHLPALQHAESHKYHYSSNITQHSHTEPPKTDLKDGLLTVCPN